MITHQDAAEATAGRSPPAATEFHALSDIGDVRRHNEDSFLIDAALGLAAVADGMGGHLSGEIASAGALAALQACLSGALSPRDATQDGPGPDPDATTVNQRWRHTAVVMQAVERANATLYAANQARGHADGAGMGSTLTGFLLLPETLSLVAFHVGDSRLYRYRDHTLELLTRDQTAYQLALESGAPGALPPPNLLLQAVGPAPAVTPDLALFDCRDGDLLLLCSDGLHGWVPHAELAETLAQRDVPLARACESLIALAKRHGSRDNITALLARIPPARL
ncbi:protein phosphatase [Duganella sp. CF517]|uniref:PP2C family protein-serine/threonine phosphatase n=1 Tax=Duganella sp. CF517 TaxID=1881038 RepID=UPI0008C86187|nr:protein phosphatase 2C domain-containing protein [Duganella sp. CF517]SEN08626.1 protein phosphatase [Duganella sp. CF517]